MLPTAYCANGALTWEISRHGSLPTWAPVKPYTELALTFSANCRPSKTCRRKGSVSLASSALALEGQEAKATDAVSQISGRDKRPGPGHWLRCLSRNGCCVLVCRLCTAQRHPAEGANGSCLEGCLVLIHTQLQLSVAWRSWGGPGGTGTDKEPQEV